MTDKRLFSKPEELEVRKGEDFVATIPAGLANRQALFKVLQVSLKFPDYFGYNWDALSECLRDLSWIKQRRVIISHHDVPLSDLKDTEMYLDILKTCSEYWTKKETHELLIAMP
jgi:RNAse (barnase) inhibitor barstar